jgi:superfamily II DNA or RNA helicase
VQVPSLALLNQTLIEWRKNSHWGESLRTMCVCSDPSVVQGLETDDIMLADVEFPVVTDPQVVRAFLEAGSVAAQASQAPQIRHGTEAAPVSVIFCTYQSAAVVGQALREAHSTDAAKAPAAFDFLIADEAHKTARDGNSMSYCLHDENIPAAKRIFFTATPRHYILDDDAQESAVVSMDNQSLYGPRAYTLSFKDAAERGIIVPYKVVVSVVDSTQLDARQLADGQVIHAGRSVDASALAHQIALAQAVRAHDLKRVMSFHSRVAQASAFVGHEDQGTSLAELLPDFRLLHVNGSMGTSQRKEVMNSFATQRRALISNARCLTEGVDVPSVDMVAFVDPRKSRVDIAQAAGRAMRPSPETGKTTGFIFVPLLLSPRQGESLAQAAQRAGYTDVITTLKAMQEIDDFRGNDLGDRLEIVLPDPRAVKPSGSDDRGRAVVPADLIDPRELLDAIRIQIVDRLLSGWHKGLEAASAYHEEHGHLRVPQDHVTASGFKLGSWISEQRQSCHEDRLGSERKAALDQMGMVWDALANQWQQGLDEALAYYRAHGNLQVRAAHVTASGFRLGGWVSNRREDLKAGRLDPARRAALDELGMTWSRHDEQWHQGLQEARAYRQSHGHLVVPREHVTESGFKLGTWISNRRADFKAGRLAVERKSVLDSLDMVWLVFDRMWQQGFEQACAYRQANNHLRVPDDHITSSGFKLGIWVGNRRKDLKTGSLDPERKAALDTLGMDWGSTGKLLASQAPGGVDDVGGPPSLPSLPSLPGMRAKQAQDSLAREAPLNEWSRKEAAKATPPPLGQEAESLHLDADELDTQMVAYARG